MSNEKAILIYNEKDRGEGKNVENQVLKIVVKSLICLKNWLVVSLKGKIHLIGDMIGVEKKLCDRIFFQLQQELQYRRNNKKKDLAK